MVVFWSTVIGLTTDDVLAQRQEATGSRASPAAPPGVPGFSDAQFDLDTLRSRGLSPSLAEYFRHAPRFAPGDQPVQVTVNGRVLGRKTANFDASGSLCFTPAFVRDTGLVSMDDSPIDATAVEAPCRDYRRFSPRTVVTLLPTVGSVDITVPPEHVMPDPRSADEERGGRGAMFNYRAFALESHSSGGRGSSHRYLDTTLGLNLDDGGALMVFRMRDGEGRAMWASATLRDGGGERQFAPADIEFSVRRTWLSPRTAGRYPVAMSIRVGSRRFELQPLMDDQELDSRASSGAIYWEGAVSASEAGRPVGRGYLELTGYAGALRL